MASQHPVAASYDTVAADYDQRFSNELDGKARDCELLDRLAARSSGIVLDVGSGPGHIGARIRAAGRPVVAVDISLAMTQTAAKRVDAAVVADMVHMPVRTASVADIVAFYSLIHLPRLRIGEALREFARVLVPGGHILLSAHEGTDDVTVSEFLGHLVSLSATFLTLDELVDAAAGADLTVIRAERRVPYENEGSTNRLYVELSNR